jgi:hypothetical protein
MDPSRVHGAVLAAMTVVLAVILPGLASPAVTQEAARSAPGDTTTFLSDSGKVRVVVDSSSSREQGAVRYRVLRDGSPPREVRFPVRLQQVAVLDTGEFAGFGYGDDDSVPPKRFRTLAMFGPDGACLLDRRTLQSHPRDSGWGPKAFAIASSDACRSVVFAVYDPEGVSRRQLLVYSLPKADLVLDCQVVPPGVDPASPHFSEERKGGIISIHWIGKRPALLVTWDQALPYRLESPTTDEGDAFTVLDSKGRVIWTASLIPVPGAKGRTEAAAEILPSEFAAGRAEVDHRTDSFVLHLRPKDRARELVDMTFDVREEEGGQMAVRRR